MMMKRLKGEVLLFRIAASLFFLFSPAVFGQDVIILPVSYEYEVVDESNEVDYCISKVSEKYGINPEIFYAIAKIESGFNPYAYRKNRNGTVDIGLMQINSQTARHFGYSPSQLWDICTNVEVAALKLRSCYQIYGESLKTIGCYHSNTAYHMRKYIRLFEKVYYKMR